jgi:PhzF family phenazine biosynthesis protein
MTMRPFRQIDVFGAGPYRGNPVAVILDAEGLETEEMRRISEWTNLSEVTFVLPPTTDAADYRVRIFRVTTELPFAGHPTLGTARAWLDAGGVPRSESTVVQECGAGLVPVRIDGDTLSFAAPPTIRGGAVDPADLGRFAAVLGIDPDSIVDAQWVDNGPGWVGILLDRAETALALTPDASQHPGRWDIGVLAPSTIPEAQWEVRGFFCGEGEALREDPVTGSLNASLAQWLLDSGRASAPYTARQGTALGRDGRVLITADGRDVWVGGATHIAVRGEIDS